MNFFASLERARTLPQEARRSLGISIAGAITGVLALLWLGAQLYGSSAGEQTAARVDAEPSRQTAGLFTLPQEQTYPQDNAASERLRMLQELEARFEVRSAPPTSPAATETPIAPPMAY